PAAGAVGFLAGARARPRATTWRASARAFWAATPGRRGPCTGAQLRSARRETQATARSAGRRAGIRRRRDGTARVRGAVLPPPAGRGDERGVAEAGARRRASPRAGRALVRDRCGRGGAD